MAIQQGLRPRQNEEGTMTVAVRNKVASDLQGKRRLEMGFLKLKYSDRYSAAYVHCVHLIQGNRLTEDTQNKISPFQPSFFAVR